MPEISDAELRQFIRYQNLGTPEEVSKKIHDLEVDNRKYRQEEKPALEARLPKDDEVIIKKADADLLPKFKELGDPKEIKAKLTEGEEAKGKLTQVQLREAATKFARAAGLADESVDTLMAIPALQGATFEVRKGKVKNEKGVEVDADIAYVTLPGENQKEMTFVEARDQVTALKGLATAAPVQQKPAGANYVPQGTAGGSEGGSSVYDRIRAEVAAKQPKPDEKPKDIPIAQRLGARI